MTTAEGFVAKVKELQEARGEIKPPSPERDSPVTNFVGFWTLAVTAGIGAVVMLVITIAERPAAFPPLMLFLSVAAAALGVMYHQLLSGEKTTIYEEKPWLRWFTATGVIIAIILAGGSLLMLPPLLWPVR
ncbi:MAG: hypothetical protein WAP51_04625 [Candidatus Sungiibacteriota bacterium]